MTALLVFLMFSGAWLAMVSAREARRWFARWRAGRSFLGGYEANRAATRRTQWADDHRVRP